MSGKATELAPIAYKIERQEVTPILTPKQCVNTNAIQTNPHVWQ